MACCARDPDLLRGLRDVAPRNLQRHRGGRRQRRATRIVDDLCVNVLRRASPAAGAARACPKAAGGCGAYAAQHHFRYRRLLGHGVSFIIRGGARYLMLLRAGLANFAAYALVLVANALALVRLRLPERAHVRRDLATCACRSADPDRLLAVHRKRDALRCPTAIGWL